VNGIVTSFSGTPYSIGGTNTPLNWPGLRLDLHRREWRPETVGSVGSSTEPCYDIALFSQPTGLGAAGFGNSGRNGFRRPSVWNVDLSLFKSFQVGRLRPEFRLEAANVFNHTNWGAPVTGFTANNFLRFTPGSAENVTNTPGARRVQIGLRLQF
jgi:hypothetical protein